jgi:hypothetical protein
MSLGRNGLTFSPWDQGDEQERGLSIIGGKKDGGKDRRGKN